MVDDNSEILIVFLDESGIIFEFFYIDGGFKVRVVWIISLFIVVFVRYYLF